MLEKSFEEENKLEPERKTQLAKKLGLQPRQVAVWFQNRRARWKTKQLEKEYDLLKSSYDSLLANYETINKENDKLKYEVLHSFPYHFVQILFVIHLNQGEFNKIIFKLEATTIQLVRKQMNIQFFL